MSPGDEARFWKGMAWFIGIMVGLPVLLILLLALREGERRPVDIADQLQTELKNVDTSKKSTGWLWGSEYRVTDQEGGVTNNGAKVWKAYVETDATSEEDFREIASAISKEGPKVDFFWAELYEGSKTNTVGVVLDFNSRSAVSFVGNDKFRVNGGVEGDGVYVLTGEELEGYPSGEKGFQSVVGRKSTDAKTNSQRTLPNKQVSDKQEKQRRE